jgi:hypothetical protein
VEKEVPEIAGMQNLRRLTQDEIGILLALLATIFGGWARLFIPAIAGFPVNDGGLFYMMVRALQQNGFRLPAYVAYNGLDIPFAYPPLAFFVGGFLSNTLHINVTDILRWLPAIVLTATIPAFYILANAMLRSAFNAGIATLIFGFTPRAITWPVMGGGLTRSFGFLFLLLALASLYLLFTQRGKTYLVLSILFSSLLVMTHPEATVHAIGLSLLLWIFKARDREGTLAGLYVGLGTLILSAVWWIPLLVRLGPDPLLAAAQTGSHSALAILYPVFAVLTDEPLMTVVAVLGAMGLAIRLVRRDYLLPAAYLVPFIVDPRSSATYAMIPLAMLAGSVISDTILPALAGERNGPASSGFQNLGGFLFMLCLGFYLLGSTLYFGTQIAATALTPSDREAFEWISVNSPADGRFLILTGDDQLFCDSVPEWFPALTERISLTTIQGNEWLPGRYKRAVDLQSRVQACLNGPDPLACVEEKQLDYDYLYIARRTPLKNLCRVLAPAMRAEGLIATLRENPRYRLAYETDSVAIFAYQR